MKEFYGNNWRKILNENNLGDFNSLWELDAGWFEQPNKRRGGWSGVSRIKLELPEGGEVGVFLKRQENHVTKTIFHPVKGIPTFQREYRNILRFIKKGLPTVEPVYFGRRNQEGKLQAILMTRELEGYQSLDANHFCRRDDNLVDKCMKTTGIKTQRALIDHALRELLRHESQTKILELKGKVNWEGDLNEWRRGRN